VIFRADAADAQHLTKGLQGLIEVDDLITMETGQAIARIDTDVVRFRGLKPRTPRDLRRAEAIISESHRRYYRPAREVRRAILSRGELSGGVATIRPIHEGTRYEEKNLQYDTL